MSKGQAESEKIGSKKAVKKSLTNRGGPVYCRLNSVDRVLPFRLPATRTRSPLTEGGLFRSLKKEKFSSPFPRPTGEQASRPRLSKKEVAEKARTNLNEREETKCIRTGHGSKRSNRGRSLTIGASLLWKWTSGRRRVRRAEPLHPSGRPAPRGTSNLRGTRRAAWTRP